MDLDRKQFKKEVGGEDLIIEVSKIAEQANGAVIASYGDTTVLATAVMEDKDVELPYMPLRVDYEEKFYSIGKIPGGFFKREGRPSNNAILSGRLIDHAIRPLFDKRIRRPIQITATILSYDGEHDLDFVALNAVSVALGISDIPWNGPIAGVDVARVEGSVVINPTKSLLEEKKAEFSSFFSGTVPDGGADSHINMIEFAGDNADEGHIVDAAREAMRVINELNSFQADIIKKIGKPKVEIKFDEASAEFLKEMKSFLDGKLEDAVYVKEKTERVDKVSDVKIALKEHLTEKFEDELGFIEMLFEKELDDLVHKNVLTSDRRADGRALDEVRELYAETGLLPRTHGSGFFLRGGTQALGVVTLGPPGAQQLIETIEHFGKERFLMHYNFPPFSVGEARSFRGPGRRDIGHGALAEKAIRPLIPGKDEFPYTIRVVSEILASNGSSSMATVSAASLSLMDAGVPIKASAAGIAIGLITGPDGTYKILTDIQGPEDHYGDMDLKVAGTRDGVNAIQMDVKIQGITIDILGEALEAAKKARLHILDATDKVLHKPREELSKYAPHILSVTIDPSKIGEVIGPGGKIINGIIEDTGAESIDIDDDGTVFITAASKEAAQAALYEVTAIVKDLEIGETIEGKVIKLLEFGAIVEFPGGKSGLVHVSELKDEFVKDVSSVLNEGDTVKVKVLKIENGKTSLSLKQAEG